MSESQRRSTEQLFTQAKNIHSTVRTNSTELQNKLEFMQKKIQDHSSFFSCGFCTRSKTSVDDAFKRAFKTLSLSQQVGLFWKMCTIMKQIKQNTPKQQSKNINNPEKHEKQMLDTTIYIKDKNEYKEWTVTRIKASLKTCKIAITDKSAVIDMRQYIIRNAKNKQRQCFALESTSLTPQYQTIKISSEGHPYQETLNFFKKLKRKALYEQVCALIDPKRFSAQKDGVQIKIPKAGEKIQRKSLKTSGISTANWNNQSIHEKMMTLKITSPQYGTNSLKLIQKQMIERQRVIRLRDTSYSEIYKYLLPPKLIQNLQSVSNFEKVRKTEFCQTYYSKKQQIVKKQYKFRCSQILIFDWLVDQLNNFSNFKKWKTNMSSISCLRIFPSQKTKIFHQVYTHQNNKKINYVFVRHHFDMINTQNNGSRNKKIYYFYDQSVVLPIVKSYFNITEPIAEISYILWKFYQQNDCFHLSIQAKCDHFTTPQNNLKMIQNYLGQFQLLKNHAANYIDQEDIQNEIVINTVIFENQYIQKIDQIEDIDHDTEFFTVTDTFNQKGGTLVSKDSKDNSLRFKKGQPSKASFDIKKRVSLYEDFDRVNEANLLLFRHPVKPYKKGTPNIVKTNGGHFHWEKQWIINNKGQLINTNKQKIQAQNNVLRSVFKRLGRNLMSGKSILSISLPVEAFGEDSNLSRICNSYGYAPLLLEEAAKMTDPFEKFKRVIFFSISSTVSYIKMDKPFNPILGQTYQSLIDGCPVYGQQISHHPPISAMFMKGRGYTLYGHLEAKVEMNLNSANGINEGQMNVSFNHDDYSKDVVKYTTAAGQLSGLIFGDRKMNMIKSSMYFDPDNLFFCHLFWGKTKMKSDFSKNYYDAVQGQIVKLKSSFDPKKWKNVKKGDIQKQLALVNGRWTGEIFCDKQSIINSFKTPPFQVQIYQALLQSDVSKRKDLMLRIGATDLQPAQQAKQELEQIQRNDRKLRAQYLKKNK